MKAQQLRESNRHVRIVRRNIIIGLVALILVVIIGAIAAVIIQSNHKAPRQPSCYRRHRITGTADRLWFLTWALARSMNLPTLTNTLIAAVCGYDVAFGEQATQDALDVNSISSTSR